MERVTYCDYAFYRDSYLGDQIGEADFPRLAQRASDYLGGLTGGRTDRAAGPDLDRLKRAACAVAEAIQDEERALDSLRAPGGAVSGETVGNWSVRYAQADAGLLRALDRRKAEAARLWLGGLPLFAPVFRARSWPCIPPIL